MRVVVVGSGSGGAAFAGTLAAGGRHHVVLLEAGPDYGPFEGGGWPAELLQTASLPRTHDWGLANEDTPGGRRYELGRAKVIGGCSSHNGCSAVRGLRGDFEGWCTATGSDVWRADAVLPDFLAIERALRLRSYPPEEVPPFQARAFDAAMTLGLPATQDFNDLDEGPAVGFCPVNKAGDTRWNCAFAFLDPVRDTGRLEILDRCEATQVLLEGQRAVGVRAARAGRDIEVTGDLLVLAGGAYGSPMLLLASGIGAPDALDAAGIATRHALPGVGRNLQDHPSVLLRFAGSPTLEQAMLRFGETAVPYEEGLIVKARSSRATTAIDLHLVPCGGRLPDGAWNWEILVALVAARGRGLIEPLPGGAFAIRHRHFQDADDRAAAREGIALARRLAAAFPDLGAELEPGPDADLAAVLRDGHVHYWHPAGSCAMGRDPAAGAVTDAEGRVHGLAGLMVADASIMPTVVAANTNLATVMLGYRLARRLLAQEGLRPARRSRGWRTP
jgi:choline dehydrogenase